MFDILGGIGLNPGGLNHNPAACMNVHAAKVGHRSASSVRSHHGAMTIRGLGGGGMNPWGHCRGTSGEGGQP